MADQVPVLTPVYSEILADALRAEQVDHEAFASPFAACLLPLLNALGWNQYARELIEALPHFSERFDLVDLRNVLVNLGYESTPKRCRAGQIDPELLPCLFVTAQGKPLVLLRAETGQTIYVDPEQKGEQGADLTQLRGCAYLFTHLAAAHGQTVSPKPAAPWFTRLYRRFGRLTLHLLVMTLLINLVAMAVPLFIMVVYDKVIGAGSVDALPMMVTGIVLALGADALLRYFRGRLLGNIAGRMDYLIATETFKKVLSLPPLLTERSTVAAQLSRIKQFDSVREFFTGANASTLLDIPFIPLLLGLIAAIAGWTALVPGITLVLFAVFGLVWVPISAARVLRAGVAQNDRQRMLIQSLGGRGEIKRAAAEQSWLGRYREYTAESATANYQAAVASGVINAVSQAGVALASLAVLVVGAQAVMAGEMTVGALIATMVLTWRVLAPMQQTFLSLSRFRQVMAAVRQLNQLMAMEGEVSNRASSVMRQTAPGRVVIERVSFRYSPARDPALSGISLTAEPGELVAITGSTGAGKSTLVKLVAGMYAPQGGSIAMDGQDIRQLNARELRHAIAYVPQSAQLFYGTIAQNMRMNNPLATDEDLEVVARILGIHEEIKALPDGFQTLVGDARTQCLTPGFIHSITMARAFLCSAQVLILDEPGAVLDRQSDKQLQQQLMALKGRKTVLLVTHRPSHIRLADKVLVLDKGAARYLGQPDEALQILVGGIRAER